MKRSRSVSRYAHTIEGSSQDITVDVEDTGKITNLSQTSKEYRKMDTGNEQRDVYDFPRSSEPKITTKKVPAKTTMESLNTKTTKTYGKSKVGRSRTMVAPSSSPATPAAQRQRRGSDAGRAMDSSAEKLSSSPPVVQEQAPKRSLKEIIQRKKEEKAAAMKQKEDITMVEAEDTIIVGEPAKVKTPVKTYEKIKRSKTSVASVSPALADKIKRSTDDIGLDKHKKRKSDVHVDDEAPFELPLAKRYQRRKSMAGSPQANTKPKDRSPADIVDLSSSQVDPVDQVPDTIVTPTSSMPKPLLISSTDTVLVPATKSQDESSSSTAPNGKAAVDSHESVIMDSNVSVVKATKSPSSKESSTGHGHPGTPSFDSSQEKAETASSVLKKVNELVNSPAAPATGQKPDTSSPLAISFDKGLVGRSIVLVPGPTDSQKEQYQAVSVSSDDGHAATASLPAVMSAAKVEKWSGASSTVANSTWKERNSGGDSGQKRAPSMEPLSSQPAPSSRRPNKRSKTVTESTTPTRRGRSASVHSDAPPSSGGSDVVVKSGRKKIGRSKTIDSGDEPVKSSSQPRRTHVVKTIITYEKLKNPDESAPSLPNADLGADFEMADTQAGSARGTKRKSDAADLDVNEEPQPPKSQEKSQVELDLEMARKLQEEMDKEDAEPETRAKRRGAPSPKVVDPEPETVQSSLDAGFPSSEMYKPRLSSRRSKSLSAKADPSAIEALIDALPRPGRKGKGKRAAKEKEAPVPEEVKENVEPQKEPAVIDVDAGGDIVMEGADMIVVDEAPKSFFSREKSVEKAAAPVKVLAVPKKIGRAKSKSSAPAVTAVQDEDAEDEVVAPKKPGRAAKAVINDTNDSGDELMMDVDEELVKPKATARGRGAPNKRAASITASVKTVPKSKERVDSEDDDDDEEMPAKPTGRSNRSKPTEKAPAAKPSEKPKEIVDTDDDQDEDEVPSEPASPVKAPTPAPAPKPAAVAPTPLPKPRGITRQKSTPGFKAPTMTRNKSISVETDVPQTPRKDKEQRGSQELTPKSTPPGTVPHSPLRGGVVPLRVGLSKRTRLPSLLKIIRKDK